MNKAIFLDRDGIINKLVYNILNKEFEPPHRKEDFVYEKGVIKALKLFQKNNFYLFIISNQPDYAKGKTLLKNIKSVHKFFDSNLIKKGIFFKYFYYCYHHPYGIIKKYSIKCKCRKPGILFLQKAEKKFNIDIKKSWFIGDRDTDIICGKNYGLNTLLVRKKESILYTGKTKADFEVNNLLEATNIILQHI